MLQWPRARGEEGEMGGWELHRGRITGPWGCARLAAAIPVASQAVGLIRGLFFSKKMFIRKKRSEFGL